MKKCGRCKQVKEYTEYGSSGRHVDGLKPTCKYCRSIQAKQATKRRRMNAFKVIDKDIKCACCHESYLTVFLELDHIKPVLRKQGYTDPHSRDTNNNIIKNGNTIFQILCANCNKSKGTGNKCTLIHKK